MARFNQLAGKSPAQRRRADYMDMLNADQKDLYHCPSCGREWAQRRVSEHGERQTEPMSAFCSDECERYAVLHGPATGE